MHTTNPTRLSPNLDPGGTTRPNSTRIWTLGAQPDPKLGSNRFHLGLLSGLNPNLNLFEANPTRVDLFFFTLRANPTRLNPNFGSKIRLNPKKRVGFGCTRGPSINYVVSKSVIFDPLPLFVVFLLHKIGNFSVSVK